MYIKYWKDMFVKQRALKAIWPYKSYYKYKGQSQSYKVIMVKIAMNEGFERFNLYMIFLLMNLKNTFDHETGNVEGQGKEERLQFCY